MTANAGFSTLPQLDFNGGGATQNFCAYAKAAGGHLDDGMVFHWQQFWMPAAFAAVPAGVQDFGGRGHSLLGWEAERTEAHGGEQKGGF